MNTHLSSTHRLVILLCTLSLPVSCISNCSNDKLHKLKRPEFTFQLPDLEGNVVSSGDQRFENKVVLFDIWGTWCPPCREMTPVLNELHAKYASEGLEIVGAAFELSGDEGEDPKELVKQYVADNDIRYIMLYGGEADHPSSHIFQKLPFREFDGFPTVVLIGRDGKASRVEEHFNEGTAGRLEAAIQELLASN